MAKPVHTEVLEQAIGCLPKPGSGHDGDLVLIAKASVPSAATATVDGICADYLAGLSKAGGQLGNLTNLTTLDLSNNQLSGNLPPELGNLTNLTRLYLSNNHFQGDVPVSFANLTNLKHLEGNSYVFDFLHLENNCLNHPASTFALAGYLALYDAGWEKSQHPGLVHGRVTNAAGDPLANIPVQLNGPTSQALQCTNQNGEYWFNADFNLSYQTQAGSLSVNPCGRANPYWPQTAAIQLSSAVPTQTNLDFVLEPITQVFTFYLPFGQR